MVPEGISFTGNSPTGFLPKQSPTYQPAPAHGYKRWLIGRGLTGILLPGSLFLGLSEWQVFYRATGDRELCNWH